MAYIFAVILAVMGGIIMYVSRTKIGILFARIAAAVLALILTLLTIHNVNSSFRN